MPRSRASIQQTIDLAETTHRAYIARLQAERDAAQPETVTVRNVNRSGSLELTSKHGSLDVFTRHAASNTSCLNIFIKSDVVKLRDFLNYHFPKETI